MRSSTLVSRSDSLICPLCEVSKLHTSNRNSMICESCGGHLSGSMLETLRRISALPDALGKHPCECGHPEMRRLPDGTFHCPACGSEVLPSVTPSALAEPRPRAGFSGLPDTARQMDDRLPPEESRKTKGDTKNAER